MNNKVTWKPGTMLAPVPAVMVTCRSENKTNIITIGWAGTICSEPPMVSISVRPSRFSYNLIKKSGEFVINIPTKKLARETDLCGVISAAVVAAELVGQSVGEEVHHIAFLHL